MKTKLITGTLFLAVLRLFAPDRAGAAIEAGTCARFNDWQDFGCHQSPGGAGAPSSGANNAGGNNASCPVCPSPTGSPMGMPRWWVDEPYINLHIVDEPLSYKMSSGKDMTIRFFYKERYQVPALDQIPNLMTLTDGIRHIDAYYSSMTDAQWSHNWMMSIVFWDATYEDCRDHGGGLLCGSPYVGGYEALLYTPEGGIDYFINNVTNQTVYASSTILINPASQVQLVPLGTNGYPVAGFPLADSHGIYWGVSTNGFTLIYPDGSSDQFGLTIPSQRLPSDTTAQALLSQRIDPQGRITRLGYEAVNFTNNCVPVYPPVTEYFRLRYLVDPDGRTNTFLYVPDGTNGLELQQIDDPFGRKVTFSYGDCNDWLASITDTAGNSNAFHYEGGSSGWMSSLLTPYGTTSFSNQDVMDGTYTSNYQMRAICVTEPTGAMQLFGYYHNASGLVESNAVAPSVSEWVFDTGANGGPVDALYYRNSFHWDRLQTANLSSSVTSHLPGSPATAISDMGTNDLQKGQMQHWLLNPMDGVSITETLSSERDPSPDPGGTIEGQRTWYAYTNQTPPDVLTTTQIGCVAQILPGGTSQYARYTYYSSGLVATNEQSCSLPGGGLGEVTNWFYYNGGNGIDLTEIANSLGQSVNMGYNGSHQVTSITDALNEVTTLAWNGANHNLTNVVFPNGQTMSLYYYPSNTAGHLYNTNSFLSQVTVQPENRATGVTDYTNALPRIIHVTGTGVPDLWTTNTWDKLNHLTGVVFQDGTTVSNIYTNLDLIARKDRIGNWTYYAYDGLQHLLSITDARSNVTQFTWCECGSLTSISNALGYFTDLNYDNQERLTNVSFPDLSSLNWRYDLSGRMTNQFDGSGNWQQYAYNNQNQVIAVNNTYGQLFGAYLDAVGRPVLVTNANGVVVSNGFDLINRLTNRLWIGGGNEYFGYATNGLIAYTNQDSQWTHFGRDAAGRLIALTNAVQIELFGYDALDDLTTLIDGLNHTTTWTYNQYGWLTSKSNNLGRTILTYSYDSDGRVTNRWMMGTNTQYRLDAVGNVTNVIYPAFTDAYKYDAVNELTNMTDPAGTTTFAWTPTGQLAGETGPWASNTVSYGYSQGHRNSLSLSQPSGPAWSQTYGYDYAWRMTNITSGAGAFGYQYPSSLNHYLVGGITLPNGAYILNQYDTLSRLTNTALLNYWGHPLDGYVYGLDSLGLRTNIIRQLGLATNNVSIGYDPIGELSSWIGKENSATGTPRQNEQLGYAYDAANNLHLRTNNALVQTFTVDSLNQLSNVTRSGMLTVSGALPAPSSSVTVNGAAAQTNGDFTFARTNNSLSNGTNTFTIVAQNVYGAAATNALSVNLPATVSFQYDANGNLTNDGTRVFAYDAENRLTNVLVAGQWRTAFVYDGLSRRRSMTNFTWQSGAWLKTNETRYICDGMLLLQERNSNNTPVVTYTRGLDLSMSLQGGGGIGGMLTRTDTNGPTYYHSDGNGNVTALIDGNCNIAARYEYDPFGRVIGQWGTMASVNTMGFSSMPRLGTSGLIGYPLREYDPILSRWLNRDLIGEAGGINLYGFNYNNPMFYIDPYGLAPGDWWDARTYFNSGFAEGWSDAANTIGQTTGGSLALLYDVGAYNFTVARQDVNYIANAGNVSQGAYDAIRGFDPTGLLPPDPNDPNAEAGLWLGMAASMLDGQGEIKAAEKAVQGARAAKAAKAAAKCAKTPKFKELEAALDATGKVHGTLPNPSDLSRYHPEDLQKLLDELRQSVQERISKTARYGSDPQHAARQTQEQQLIQAIQKYLSGQ